LKPKNSLTIKIESLSYSGGRGVGRADGLVVFVPGTAPGDLVEVQITNQKPRFAEGQVVRVLEPSPSRREPPCPVANRCGGCSWQHVTYAEQIQQKDKIVRDALRKVEKRQAFEWRPLVPAPSEFGYRNRIQLQVREGRYGFFSKGTRDLVAIDQCLIAEETLNQQMKALTAEQLKATRIELAIRSDGSSVTMLEQRDPEEALFSQVNTAQNAQLIRLMLENIDGTPDWIFDLYCGSGNLTVPLAEKFPDAKITAVDLSRASIQRAPKLNHVEFVAGDVVEVLGRLRKQNGSGLVVLDPPRTGCDARVLEQVRRLQPKQIVYVSCNPSTFARDVERLLDGGHRLKSVQALDMFPQTEHVELVAALSLSC
jgi:23S rRNA (uracil1939-C5)-methyltransferase